jgi:23S rRNA pseudouridine1911/1915/1917 synthase
VPLPPKEQESPPAGLESDATFDDLDDGSDDLDERDGRAPEATVGARLAFVVGEPERELRVDQFLARRRPDLSRSYIQILIDEGKATVDGEICRRSERLRPEQTIELELPPPEAYELKGEDVPIRIVHEDSDIVVVDKAAGMVVHPTTHDRHGTLVHALLFHVTGLSGINGVERPGIVHRIDKDTSGLLVVAKNDTAHHRLGEQFRAHSIDRNYALLCWGRPAPSGTAESNIGRHPKDRRRMASVAQGGKHAVTHWRLLEALGPASLVQCSLETGRTHQIRVHMTERGHPLLGDPVYGGRDQQRIPKGGPWKKLLGDLRGQMLHAATLGFLHPGSGHWVQYRSEPPLLMMELIRGLRRAQELDPDGPGPWSEGWEPIRR